MFFVSDIHLCVKVPGCRLRCWFLCWLTFKDQHPNDLATKTFFYNFSNSIHIHTFGVPLYLRLRCHSGRKVFYNILTKFVAIIDPFYCPQIGFDLFSHGFYANVIHMLSACFTDKGPPDTLTAIKNVIGN